MMSWNYRVIKEDTPEGEIFSIHEVYYNEDGEIVSYAIEPETLVAATFNELQLDLELILRDLEKCPILDKAELDQQIKAQKEEDPEK